MALSLYETCSSQVAAVRPRSGDELKLYGVAIEDLAPDVLV